MRVIIAILVIFTVGFIRAAEVRISLHEKDPLMQKEVPAFTCYAFKIESATLTSLASASGKALQQTNEYSIEERRLSLHGKRVAKADEILYQCHVGGCDLVIVRDEYNSFSNPLRILSAFSGHPIQVSKIVILTIVDGDLKSQTEIIRRPASYEWTASIME
jgi:hypothetical protein